MIARKTPRPLLFIGAVAAGIGLLALSSGRFDAQAAAKTVPSIQVTDLKGKTVKVNLKGKTNLVVFWASWCGPCLSEAPDLNALQKKYGKKGFSVQAVSVDDQGLGVVKKAAKQKKMAYPVYLGNAKAVSAFGQIDAIPASFLVNKKGQIVRSYVGTQDPKLLERDIKNAMR